MICILESKNKIKNYRTIVTKVCKHTYYTIIDDCKLSRHLDFLMFSREVICIICSKFKVQRNRLTSHSLPGSNFVVSKRNLSRFPFSIKYTATKTDFYHRKTTMCYNLPRTQYCVHIHICCCNEIFLFWKSSYLISC